MNKHRWRCSNKKERKKGSPEAPVSKALPQMDHSINGKRIHMKSNKTDIEPNTHQETRSRDEVHARGTIIGFFFNRSSYLFICLFIYFIMCLMYVRYGYLIYEFMLMCLYIYIYIYIYLLYFIVYSSYSNCVAAHGVDIHRWARDQPVGAGALRLIIIGVFSVCVVLFY